MSVTDLKTLIRSMNPHLVPDVFVFVTIPNGTAIPIDIEPMMLFYEDEGTTLILPRDQALKAGLTASFPARMITLKIASSLEAVGFLAAITAALAKAGIAVNPVSAFHHDHLFVPEGRAGQAMTILHAMAETGL